MAIAALLLLEYGALNGLDASGVSAIALGGVHLCERPQSSEMRSRILLEANVAIVSDVV